MIPLAIPNMCGNEGEYLQECIRTNFVSSVGPFVTRFEEMVAKASGAEHCVATSSGTAGLHAALTAVGVTQGDLVILPAFTFIASANAIAHCGATPWLFDISKESWTLDPEQLRATLKSTTLRRGNDLIHSPTGKRVSAIMPVHTLGTPADMDALSEIAAEFKLMMVVDGAPALGAKYNQRELGEYGDLTVFSFNGNKIVTSGGGGAVVGNNEELVGLVKHLTTTARVGKEYHHDRVGFNYRMTNIQAAVGCAQMEHLKHFLDAKRKIHTRYATAFADTEGLTLFPTPNWGESSRWFSGVVVDTKVHFPVSKICDLLAEKGIMARTFWKPIHLQPPYRDAPAESTNLAESVWNRILTLPCSTGLTQTEQEHVISSLNSILQS